MQHNTHDVIIIGAGLGGLFAATTLAARGLNVALLERSPRLGGRARAKHTHDAWINQGPHALYRGGPAFAALSSLLGEIKGRAPINQGRIWSPGVGASAVDEMPMPYHLGHLLASGRWSAKERSAMIKTFAKISMINLSRLDADQSFGHWLSAQALPARVERFFSAVATVATYCAEPAPLPQVSVLRQLGRVFKQGVLYLDGGWQRLVDGLEHKARARGVTIQLGAKVSAINRREHAHEVLLGDERFSARDVIIATPPDAAQRLLGAHSWSLTPCEAACMDLLIQGKAPQRAFEIGLDGKTYLSVHSRSAQLAAPGQELIHVARYVRADEPREGDAQALAAIIAQAWPQWEQATLFKRTARFCVSHGLPQLNQARPSASQGQGLWLLGDWVDIDDPAQAPELLLDGVIQVAQHVCASILATTHHTSRLAV